MEFTFSISFGINFNRNRRLSTAESAQLQRLQRRAELQRIYDAVGVTREN